MDNLTLAQVDELTCYWEDNPPVHLMVKAYLGIESKKKGVANTVGEDELKALVASFGR